MKKAYIFASCLIMSFPGWSPAMVVKCSGQKNKYDQAYDLPLDVHSSYVKEITQHQFPSYVNFAINHPDHPHTTSIKRFIKALCIEAYILSNDTLSISNQISTAYQNLLHHSDAFSYIFALNHPSPSCNKVQWQEHLANLIRQ